MSCITGTIWAFVCSETVSDRVEQNAYRLSFWLARGEEVKLEMKKKDFYMTLLYFAAMVHLLYCIFLHDGEKSWHFPCQDKNVNMH